MAIKDLFTDFRGVWNSAMQNSGANDAIKGAKMIGSSVKNAFSNGVEKTVDTVSPLAQVDLKQGFSDLADAINQGFGAWSSSAVQFEKEALKAQQDFNAQQAQIAFDRSQSSAREQMDFQRSEREQAQAYNTLMSNTQYQRAVEDLRKAGINPIMAIKGLSGSAPTVQAMSGASASASAPSSAMANYTGAIKEDKRVIEEVISMLSSATKLFKLMK